MKQINLILDKYPPKPSAVKSKRNCKKCFWQTIYHTFLLNLLIVRKALTFNTCTSCFCLYPPPLFWHRPLPPLYPPDLSSPSLSCPERVLSALCISPALWQSLEQLLISPVLGSPELDTAQQHSRLHTHQLCQGSSAPTSPGKTGTTWPKYNTGKVYDTEVQELPKNLLFLFQS